MTKGVILFAFNNQEIDYVKLAEHAANRVTNFLNVPVSIVTDTVSFNSIKNSNIFDHVIIIDENVQSNFRTFKDGNEYRKKLSWKNTNRSSVYEISPYDDTLVLDVDFLINSDNLSHCWNQPHDFLIYKNSFDLATWRNNQFDYISDTAVPFYWATAFFFRKTKINRLFFSIVNHIKSNWTYYNFLYRLHSPNYRNDFAFSIAIHIMNGSCHGEFAKEFSGKLYYTLDVDHFLKTKDRDMFFLCTDNQKKYQPVKVSNLDVHVMNKYSLLRTLSNE